MKNIVINNISTSYFITEDGKLFNSKIGRYLKGQVSNSGYLNFYVNINGEKKRLYAHRLVAENYVTGQSKIRNQVNHIDGNKLNNCAENLEWVSPRENAQHALQAGLRVFKTVYCFSKNKELVARYPTIAQAARAVNGSVSIINQELNKEIKSLSLGFYWSYEPELKEVIEYSNSGKAKRVNQYDKNGRFINQYSSVGEAARSLNASHTHISECCRGKIKSYKGFVWRYYEDIAWNEGI